MAIFPSNPVQKPPQDLEGDPVTDPFVAPRLIKCCKGCKITFLLGLLIALRIGILGIVCCAWSVTNILLYIDPKKSLNDMFHPDYNLDKLFTPVGADEKDHFRQIASLVYLVDLFNCLVASMFDYCAGNLKINRIVCILWLVFTLVSYAVYGWGAARFIMKGQKIFVYYVDLAILPFVVGLLIAIIIWMSMLIRRGYITFPRPIKGEKAYQRTIQNAKEGKLTNDSEYKLLFGLTPDTKLIVDKNELEKIKEEDSQLPLPAESTSGEPGSSVNTRQPDFSTTGTNATGRMSTFQYPDSSTNPTIGRKSNYLFPESSMNPTPATSDTTNFIINVSSSEYPSGMTDRRKSIGGVLTDRNMNLSSEPVPGTSSQLLPSTEPDKNPRYEMDDEMKLMLEKIASRKSRHSQYQPMTINITDVSSSDRSRKKKKSKKKKSKKKKKKKGKKKKKKHKH